MRKAKSANRREFLGSSIAMMGGVAYASVAGAARRPVESSTVAAPEGSQGKVMTPRIRFAAVGLNHAHIYGQVDAVVRGGGELATFFAKEPELVEAFAKRYPQARLARAEREVLEDRSIQLVVSAGIPNDVRPSGSR